MPQNRFVFAALLFLVYFKELMFFSRGCQFKKCGVILIGLMPEDRMQLRQVKFKKRSGCYTTRWDELPVVG